MYEIIIGLEIHVQLKTDSKMFCASTTGDIALPPNTNVCPICMGHPGILPVINKRAIESCILAARALNCQILDFVQFDRKNYFYPDLPKGYQISQYSAPIAVDGSMDIQIPARGTERKLARIRITRAHLEEDTAKLLHSKDKKWSYVDFNRCGTPLLEIVTEPDFRSPTEAKIFLTELRSIMRCLEISDADMEKGQLRCDANISLREVIDDPQKDQKYHSQLNPKTEIKNLNSFKAVERSLEYEAMRQTKLWQEGRPPKTGSTRGWNEKEGVTEKQRIKEEAHDYRYFPEPDLPPLWLSDISRQISSVLPELPAQKRRRFQEQYGFNPSDIKILTEEKELADFTENVISELRGWLFSLEEVEGTEKEIFEKHKKKLIKLVSGWITSKLLGLMAEHKIDVKRIKITPENFAEFITLIYQNKISGPSALTILEEMLISGSDPSQIMETKKFTQLCGESELLPVVLKIIENNPRAVKDFKDGKETALQFLLGQAMKETGGRANPRMVKEIIKRELR